jgi:small subunit ribosomal protein S20
MANIASQRKRNARSERERVENRRVAGAVRTHFRRLETAVTGGDPGAADVEYRLLVSRIDKAVQGGALHANNGARKKSRAARIRASLS